MSSDDRFDDHLDDDIEDQSDDTNDDHSDDVIAFTDSSQDLTDDHSSDDPADDSRSVISTSIRTSSRKQSRGRGQGRGHSRGHDNISSDSGITSSSFDDSTHVSSRTVGKSSSGRASKDKPGKGGSSFNLVPVTESTVVPGTYESVATPLRDKLTGESTGISTLFVWENLGDSLLKIRGRDGWDVVEGCTPGVDALFAPQSITTTSISTSNGNISKLVAGQINSRVLSSDNFLANSAAAFTCTGFDGTFVAFNDGRDGYQQNSDTVLFLQGYDLAAGAVVVN